MSELSEGRKRATTSFMNAGFRQTVELILAAMPRYATKGMGRSAAKGALEAEFLEVRVVGDDAREAAARTVFVNGQVKKYGIGRPLLVQPGVHKVVVSGFSPQEVRIRGGETDFENPKIVAFTAPADTPSRHR